MRKEKRGVGKRIKMLLPAVIVILLPVMAGCGSDGEQRQSGPGDATAAVTEEANLREGKLEEAEQVLEFCRAVDAGENADLSIIVVTWQGGFSKFDLKTEDGAVTVVREYVRYDRDGNIRNMSTADYPADFWRYTEEGYLLFEGSYYSEEDFVLTLGDTTEHTALRILPLEESCREANRKYILPVGYGGNNMFLSDWSGEDFGELDFDDMFEKLYPLFYGKVFPYTAAENAGMETVYQIPEAEFENVLLAYFHTDRETLRSNTGYVPENAAYEYRPRGFDEAEYPELPCPEVVGCGENPDGTLTLTVNAVYPGENTSRLFSHLVVVRPSDDGYFQYVSNRMLTPEDELEPWWHSERSVQEERERGFLPQTEHCLFTQAEKEELEGAALAAAEQIKEVYQETVSEQDKGGNGSREFTEEQRRRAVMLLGQTGLVSVTEDANMENYERVEACTSTGESVLSPISAGNTHRNMYPDSAM